MGLRINTNIASLVAQRNLAETTRRIELHFRRLATGKRIASPADDPAGAAMSERLLAEIKSLERAKQNTEDGFSLAQIADGGLSSIDDALARARELAVEASNGTLQGSDKDALEAELSQILGSIDQIAKSTSYDAIPLLDGMTRSVLLQIGAGTLPSDRYLMLLSNVQTSALGLSSVNIGATGSPVAAISAIDEAIKTVTRERSRYGASEETLSTTLGSIDDQIANLSEANSRITDVDFAAETADLMKNKILQEAGISILAQANAQPALALRLLQSLPGA